jgi:hypothetical protein
MSDAFTEGNEFLRSFVETKQRIILTAITQEFNEMCLNWFCSLRNVGLSELALVVCADKQSYEYTQQHCIPSVYLECNIESNITGEEWIENEKNFKLLGLYIIFKNYNVDIILSDVDIVFLRNPIEKLLAELTNDTDWLAMSDKKFAPFVPSRKQGRDVYVSENKTEIIDDGDIPQTLLGEENGGFSYIPCAKSPEDKIKKLAFLENFRENSSWYKVMPRGTEEGCLQSAINKKVKDTDLKVKRLSCFEFPNGSVWNVSYIRHKIKDLCYIVHYNFSDYLEPLEVFKEKTERMKKYNHWYIS